MARIDSDFLQKAQDEAQARFGEELKARLEEAAAAGWVTLGLEDAVETAPDHIGKLTEEKKAALKEAVKEAVAERKKSEE